MSVLLSACDFEKPAVEITRRLGRPGLIQAGLVREHDRLHPVP